MTLEEFWDLVQSTFIEHITKGPSNRWRWGQTCMNVLYEVRPTLYHEVAGTIADPWHFDVSSPQYSRFVAFIEENWDPGFNSPNPIEAARAEGDDMLNPTYDSFGNWEN